MIISANVLERIEKERQYQIDKHGDAGNHDLVWSVVLTEETGEAAKEVLAKTFTPFPSSRM